MSAGLSKQSCVSRQLITRFSVGGAPPELENLPAVCASEVQV